MSYPHVSNIIWYLSFFFWLTSLSMMISRSIQIAANDIISFFFYGWVVFHCREGNGTPLQYSCLENPMDRGAWWAAVHGVAKSRTRLSDLTFTFMHWRRKWQPTPVFLPGESRGRGSLVGCRLWGRTELDRTEVTQQQQQQQQHSIVRAYHIFVHSVHIYAVSSLVFKL